MDLYFSPMACSLASRIALYEAAAPHVRFIEVDGKTKRTADGASRIAAMASSNRTKSDTLRMASSLYSHSIVAGGLELIS